MRIQFSPLAFRHLMEWQNEDRKTTSRILELIDAAARQPFTGIGKPEPLKGELKGFWSRRITAEHRLVYRVSGIGETQLLEVAACRNHYG
jgi:toxin YoeB